MYFEGCTPSNQGVYNSENYTHLCTLAQELIKLRGNEGFALYFKENQYLIDLWAAHLILEFGHPNDFMKTQALEVINRYAHMPYKLKLAQEEKDWLTQRGYIL